MQPKIRTKPYENIISEVLIDDRENERVDYALSQYYNFNPSVEHLETGDYIFKGYNGVEVCIEYKTGNDFITSIDRQENHLHNQVYDMIHSYDYCFVMVQVEDLSKLVNKRYYQTGLSMSVQEINGAISDLSTVCTVLFSQTQFGAFDLMMRLSGKIISDKPFSYKFNRKTTNSALNYLSAMKGLGSKADIIVRDLDLHCLEDLLGLTKSDLVCVDSIGDKTASMIIRNIRGE